jgi:hypothetical protein
VLPEQKALPACKSLARCHYQSGLQHQSAAVLGQSMLRAFKARRNVRQWAVVHFGRNRKRPTTLRRGSLPALQCNKNANSKPGSCIRCLQQLKLPEDLPVGHRTAAIVTIPASACLSLAITEHTLQSLAAPAAPPPAPDAPSVTACPLLCCGGH